MTDLLTEWLALLARHTDSPDTGAVGATMLARWSEPHRRYHDQAHLQAVLDAVDALADQAEDADAVRLAAWYHDAVYAGSSDDEENSALLADADLRSLRVPAALVDEVTRLVRLTVEHNPGPADRNGQVLSDADLAGLAVPPEDYRRNTARVRAEYGHVSDEDFSAGRARIIAALLSAPTLYRTAAGQRLWEKAARENLTAELRTLIG